MYTILDYVYVLYVCMELWAWIAVVDIHTYRYAYHSLKIVTQQNPFSEFFGANALGAVEPGTNKYSDY